MTYVTRNHGLLIYDTLYGFGADYKTTPQMAAVMSPTTIISAGPLRCGTDWRSTTARKCWRETVERVKWIAIPDEGTAASALQAGEVGWWEWASADLIPVLKQTIADAMQRQWFVDVPRLQTGQWMHPTAHRSDISHLLPGPALLWNVGRSG
jgi:hypothetical protein